MGHPDGSLDYRFHGSASTRLGEKEAMEGEGTNRNESTLTLRSGWGSYNRFPLTHTVLWWGRSSNNFLLPPAFWTKCEVRQKSRDDERSKSTCINCTSNCGGGGLSLPRHKLPDAEAQCQPLLRAGAFQQKQMSFFYRKAVPQRTGGTRSWFRHVEFLSQLHQRGHMLLLFGDE